MSKSTNHPEKTRVAGYGLHYHANNKLFKHTSDRIVLQYLIDTVRGQLRESINDQTVTRSMKEIGRVAGIDGDRTVSTCLDRLAKLGVIQKHTNAVTLLCDEYVTLIQYYESLNQDEQKKFAGEFQQHGMQALEKYSVAVKLQCRTELLGLSGGSILIDESEHCKNTAFSTNKLNNAVFLQQENKITPDHNSVETAVILQQFAESVAKSLYFYSGHCNFTAFMETLPAVILQCGALDDIQHAFSTGKWTKSFLSSLENRCNFTVPTAVILQCLASKSLYFYSTIIIKGNKKENERDAPQKEQEQNEEFEDYHEEIRKGLEGFGKVEVIDFNQPSENIEEDLDNIEAEDIIQQQLKRAERALRKKNSYRNKPFIKVERMKTIVECLDEVVQSPVDFFLYHFWWGVFDLYDEHYHPASRIDEEGELEEEPQSWEWREMIDAPIPQDEICALAQNVYEDLEGAVKQGKYVYGENNEWEVRFAFDSFEPFNPHRIFQWIPCTMQDRSIPAFRVAIDKFYDIEAEDINIPQATDRKTQNAQDQKLIDLILTAEDSQLSPMEAAIKKFYHDFVILWEDNMIDAYTDGKGTPLESGGNLPDHLFKPWCYNLPDVRYKALTEALNRLYRPCEGVQKRAYVFSAAKVAEWNAKEGYNDSLALQALQV